MCEDNEVANLFSTYYESMASTQFDEAFLCDHTLQAYPTQPGPLQKRRGATFPCFHSWMYEGGFRSARTKEPEMAALRLSLSLMCSSEGYTISSQHICTKLASETDGNTHVLMCPDVAEISSDATVRLATKGISD